VEKVVCGGESGMWWRKWYVVEKVVCGGESGMWWRKWYVVEKMVCGGESGIDKIFLPISFTPIKEPGTG